MKTNVVYLEQDYNVNPNKKSVFCMLTYGIDLAKVPGIEMLVNTLEFDDLMESLTNKYTGIAYFDGDASDYGMLVLNTSGQSKCAPTDEFNEDLGRKLANTRAQENAFREAKEIYDLFLMIIEDKIEGLYNLYGGCCESIDKCKQHTHDLTGHTPVQY